MGALVASAIGLVVITGITKLFVQMGAQLKQAEQKVQRINLNSLLGNYMNDPGHCKETLLPSAPQISTGNDSSLKQIKIKGGGTALDLVLEKNQLKTKYGMEGFTDIQLKCQETGGANACKKCSGPFPCPSVKWSLSLVSQTYVNQVPSFNRLLEKALVLTHTGPNDSDFECFLTAPPSALACEDRKGTIEGYDSHGNKKCYYLCPKGKTRKDGFGCDCPTGYFWNGKQCLKVCNLVSGNPISGLVKGIEIDGKCLYFDSNPLRDSFWNYYFVPSLGFFLMGEQIHYSKGSSSLTILERSKYVINLGQQKVQGFDENGNSVSFKPCPNQYIWYGSQCLEYCEGINNPVSATGATFTPYSGYSQAGVKINGHCYFNCNSVMNHSLHCFFVPSLNAYFHYNTAIHPSTYTPSFSLSDYVKNNF